MAKSENVLSGICKYVDDVLEQAYHDDDLKKILYGTGAALYIKKHFNEWIKGAEMIGVYNSKTDDIDVDMVKAELLSRVGEEGFVISKKPIGKFTFMPDDIEKLYSYIVS